MPPPINQRYPFHSVSSIDELMGLALGMEREAAVRYEEFSALMARRGEIALAKTFCDLALLERGHEAGLISWAQRVGVGEPSPMGFRWRFPETFSEEDIAGARLSPYQAMAIAVRNEEDAFAFYTYLAASLDLRLDLRQTAEALACEELSHVAQLRKLRRKAFHGQRSDLTEEAVSVATPPAFSRLAWGLERGSAELCEAAALSLERDRPEASLLLRRCVSEAACRAESMAKRAGPGGLPRASRAAEAAFAGRSRVPEEILKHCARDAGEILDTYLSIAEAAKDETVMTLAQDLAEGAVARLALIRSQMEDLAE